MGLITLIVCAEKLLPRERVVTLVLYGLLLTLGLLALAQPDLLVSAAFPHPLGSPSPGWAPPVRSAAVF